MICCVYKYNSGAILHNCNWARVKLDQVESCAFGVKMLSNLLEAILSTQRQGCDVTSFILGDTPKLSTNQ